MPNSRKYQVRNAGVGGDLASGTNNYKLNRTTGAYDTYTDDSTITTSDIVIIGKKSNISDRVDALEKNITVLAAAALLDSTVDGIAGSYTIANKLATARTIALGGDLSGSASFDGSANVTITATVAANSVALGTDTTGNYMSDVSSGTGITVTHTPGEGSTATIAINTATTVDKTTAQTLTNKSLSDSTTYIIDETDATKKLQFQVSGITTGTTRTLTAPDVNGTIITTGDTGTVTNAMLAGSIANSKLANSTISGISLGSNLATLTIGTGLSGTSYNGGTAVTIANTGVLSINGSTGTITGIANSTDVHYIGTTSVALNRASANLALTGISSVTLPGSTSGTVQLVPTAAVGTGTILTIPATTGTIVTTGDTGTVTSTMIADGTIVNADISASAAISTSKISGLATSATTDTTNASNISSGTLAFARLPSIYAGTTALQSSSANQALTGISSVTLPGSTSGTVQLVPTAAVGTGTVLTIPATTGTIVTTGDTGTVTSTMIANNTIVDADINASAAIAYSKLSLSGSIVNADISASAAIANSKLANSTISGISLGSNLATLTIGTGLSGTSYNGGTAVTIANTGVTSIAGTANQITASASTGGVTLSLPNSVTLPGDLTITGNLTINGSTITANSANAAYTDSLIELNYQNAGVLTSDNGKDIGIRFHYYKTSDKNAALVLDNATQVLEYFVDGTETTGTFSGTYGTFKGASYISTATTGTAPFTVSSTTRVANLNVATAGTADTLTTARLINGVSFNGSADVTVHTAGTGISISGTTVTNTDLGSSQNIFKNFTDGTTTAAADSNNDTFRFRGSNGVTTTVASDDATYGDSMLISLSSVPNSALANSTISGVALGSNLNTLTMAVSGTGLSGSASYNGSGAVTFTVTSNATSANTASTIVARDASGNFTAGTITAALSGNASTATTLQTARLINGVSFNGSADVTVTTAGTGISVSGTTVTNTGIISASAGTGISVSGTNPLTITNTGVTSLTGGTNISVSGSTGAVTINVTGTVANATTATAVSNTVTGTTSAELVRGNMADNDQFRILVGGTASNAGYAEIATADDGTEPIYVRQYTGVFTTLARTATLLDGSGNTSFPGSVTASSFIGNVTGNVSGTAGSISGYNNPTTANTANTIVYRDANGDFSARYGNFSYVNTSDDVSTGTVTYIMAKFGDNYHRSASAAKVAAFISGQSMNISGSSTSCSGNSASATTATNTSGGNVQGSYLGVQNTTGSTGYGISLYNGSTAGQPQYGLFFGTTANWGTHGNVTADWATYFTMDSTANRGWIFRDTVNGNKASISNTGNATFAGEVTAYSDARLKSNIVTIDNALDKVVKLRGVYFDKDGKRQIGVIAQELREVFPEVVGEANDELKTLHVNHGAMVGALIESTKDLNDKIEAQAREIAELKALVQQLLSNK